MTPKTMKLIARGLLLLVSVFLLINGLMLMFNPTAALPGMMVTANGIEGLSNVRALWGSAITAIGISVVIAAVTANIDNARPAVLFSFGLVIARLTGWVIDGYFDKVIIFTIIPIVVFGILLIAHKLLDKVAEAEAKS